MIPPSIGTVKKTAEAVSLIGTIIASACGLAQLKDKPAEGKEKPSK